MLREGLKRVSSVSTDAVLGAVVQKAAMRYMHMSVRPVVEGIKAMIKII